MKRIVSSLILTGIVLSVASIEAQARPRTVVVDPPGPGNTTVVTNGGPTRNVYVIENGRPVQRSLIVGPGGQYYRVVNGRRVVVSERVFETYPSQYYQKDGRVRPGVTIRF